MSSSLTTTKQQQAAVTLNGFIKSNKLVNKDAINSTEMTMVDRNQLIGVTHFSIGFVLDCMESSNDPAWRALLKINSHGPRSANVTHISGIGYLSHIYRIEFTFDHSSSSSPSSQSFSVVLKVPSVANLSTISNCERFLNGWAKKLAARHNVELHFYSNFAERIRRTGKVHVPKLYGSRKVNTTKDLELAFVLMEDMGQNCQMASTVNGLDKEQVEQIIDVLAMVHALSLSIPKSEESLEEFRFKCPMDDEDGQAKRTAIQGMLTVTEPEGDMFRQHQSVLERLVRENDLMRFDVHKEFGVPPVLCHGDFWCNNMFLQKNNAANGKSPQLQAILDWQFAHPNSGLLDFCRLVLICAQSSLPERYLESWLLLYQQRFAFHCAQFGIPCPYDMKLVRWMFLALYPSEMLFSFMILMNHYAKVQDASVRKELVRRMHFTLIWWIRTEKENEKAVKMLSMD